MSEPLSREEVREILTAVRSAMDDLRYLIDHPTDNYAISDYQQSDGLVLSLLAKLSQPQSLGSTKE